MSLNDAALKEKSSEHEQASLAAVPTWSWGSFWLLILLVSLPMMLPYCLLLWPMERYQFFPFAIGLVIGLVYWRWDRIFRAPRGMISWSLIALGVLCIALSMTVLSSWLGAVGFFLCTTSFLISCQGKEDVSLVTLAIPLLLIIRLPLSYDLLIVVKLQRLTTSLSSVVLDLLTIPHAAENNVIQLSTRELFVAEACSGVQSVFALMFLSVVLIVLHRRPIWLTPLYIGIAIFLALAANILRVSSVAIGDVWFNVDLATDWEHETVGYIALLVAILFLLSFDQLCVSILHPVEVQTVQGIRNPLSVIWNYLLNADDQTEKPTGGPVVRFFGAMKPRGDALWQRNIPRTTIMVAGFALMITASVRAYQVDRQGKATEKPTAIIWEPNPQLLSTLPFQKLEVTKHEVSRQRANPRLGENADIWYCKFAQSDIDIQIVLTQPYAEWHELCFCYEATNWILINRKIKYPNAESPLVSIEKFQETESQPDDASEPPNEEVGPYAIARFKRGESFAYLLYSGYSAHGETLTPPNSFGRLAARFGSWHDDTEVLMLQMLLVTNRRIAPAALNQLADDFITARKAIGQALNEAKQPLDQPPAE